MSNEVALFNPEQQTIIEQMGYSHIPQNHIRALFQRSDVMGLNPNNPSQIALIERNSKNGKTYTLQVGIAGLRRAARRIVKADGGTYSESEWLYRGLSKDGRDTGWMDLWSVESMGFPTAAKVTVTRDGQEFPHTVMWEEAVQTFGQGGNPTPMWASKPTFMLGKNAAAGAYRKAFPDELDDVYVDSERFDSEEPVQMRATRQDRGADAVRAALSQKKQEEPAPRDWQAEVKATTSGAQLNALMNEAQDAGLTEQEWDALCILANDHNETLGGN